MRLDILLLQPKIGRWVLGQSDLEVGGACGDDERPRLGTWHGVDRTLSKRPAALGSARIVS